MEIIDVLLLLKRNAYVYLGNSKTFVILFNADHSFLHEYMLFLRKHNVSFILSKSLENEITELIPVIKKAARNGCCKILLYKPLEKAIKGNIVNISTAQGTITQNEIEAMKNKEIKIIPLDVKFVRIGIMSDITEGLSDCDLQYIVAKGGVKCENTFRNIVKHLETT